MSARQTVQWPPAARERIRQMWLAGSMSASQMAAIVEQEYGFGVSKSALIGVAFRMGLSFQGRRAAITATAAERRDRQAEARKAAKERRAAAKAARPAPAPKSATVPKARQRPVPAIPDALPVSLRVPLVDARGGECRFIADDPRGGGATCCGHPVASGSPWCEAHRAICTSRTGAGSSAWIPRHLFRRAA